MISSPKIFQKIGFITDIGIVLVITIAIPKTILIVLSVAKNDGILPLLVKNPFVNPVVIPTPKPIIIAMGKLPNFLKAIAKAHKGTVLVNSQSGNGCEFVVNIPLAERKQPSQT